MSTPSSEKLKLSVAALAVPFLAYAGGMLGLNALADWAESETKAYPYVGGEDPMRFFLPSIWDKPGDQRLMITGTSGAGEGLLYEEFEDAFEGWDIVTAAMSGGALDDILIALEYMEKVYGEDSIPEVLVMGIEPRFIGSLPRHFGPKQEHWAAPFLDAINRYAPDWRVRSEALGTVMYPRPESERLRAQWDWWVKKQQPRHRTAVVTVLDRWLNGSDQTVRLSAGLPLIEEPRDPLGPGSIAIMLDFAAEVGPWQAFKTWLPAHRAPYREWYRISEGKTEFEAGGYLGTAHAWKPSEDQELLASQLGRLMAMKEKFGFRLYFVMLPEHPASRKHYDPKNIADVYEAVARFAPGVPMLDMRRSMEHEDFFDQTHTNRPGTRKLTRAVLDFLLEHEAKRPGGPPAAPPAP